LDTVWVSLLARDPAAGDDGVMRKVVVAVGASLAVASLLAGCTRFTAHAHGSVTGRVVTATAATRLPPDAVPPYFIALTAPGTPASSYQEELTVRSTRSGQVLATVRPPQDPGTFTFVNSGMMDDRTFLVGAQPWKPFANVTPPDDTGQPVSFYLLRFDPAGRRTSLVPLAVPAETLDTSGMQTSFFTASLSPDGTRLAVADVLTDNRTLAVHIYPLPAGGPGRTWTVTTKGDGSVWGTSLSWSANDRVVAVGQAYGTVWLLDTAAPAGDLVAASEAITLAAGMGEQYPALKCNLFKIFLTGDGSKLVCPVEGDFAPIPQGTYPGEGGFAFYSPATGDMTGVAGLEDLAQPAGGGGSLSFYWVSPRGTIVIGSPLRGPIGVITSGRVQPIPWSADIQSAAW
jgi:hypothetical protein